MGRIVPDERQSLTGHFRPSAVLLFDQLVRAQQQRRCNHETKCFRGLAWPGCAATKHLYMVSFVGIAATASYLNASCAP